jgi:hypothetical protein
MKTLTVACLALVVISGCEDEGPHPRMPYPLTDPQPQPNAQAAAMTRVIETIAGGTCDREQSCGTIGPGAYFGTRDDCMTAVRDKTSKAISPSMCPGGIDLKSVEKCLASLEANQCVGPGDAITRAARCAPDDLCMK